MTKKKTYTSGQISFTKEYLDEKLLLKKLVLSELTLSLGSESTKDE